MESLYLWLLTILGAVAATCVLLGRETLWLIYHTLPRDIRLGKVLAGIKNKIQQMEKDSVSVVSVFEDTVAKYPDRPMFSFQGHRWTFKEVDTEANAVAAFFQSLGLKKGQ